MASPPPPADAVSLPAAPEGQAPDAEGARASGGQTETAESPVIRIGRALAVVPSAGPSRKAWSKLGFSPGDPFIFMGCSAFDVVLEAGGLRFLVAPPDLAATPLGAAIGERLERGSGLLGWTWACRSVGEARSWIEKAGGAELPLAAGAAETVIVPRPLTPGAVTLLEPLADESAQAHRNGAERLSHIMISVGNCDAAADTYERSFGLSARRETRGSHRSALFTVGTAGGPALEVVAPAEASDASAAGYPWGLVFRSRDLDATVRYLAEIGVEVGKPVESPAGGRAVALPIQVGGISIAFAGD